MKAKRGKRVKKCNHPIKHLGPIGYVAWHEWAGKRIVKGYKQKKCIKCKLYVVWVKPSTEEKER